MKNCSSRGQQVFLEKDQKPIEVLITKSTDYLGALCLMVVLTPFLLAIFLLVWLRSEGSGGAGKPHIIKPSKHWSDRFSLVSKFAFNKYIFYRVDGWCLASK